MAAVLDSQIKGVTGGKALRRLAGADRYTTAAEIARYCVGYEGFGTDEVYIATGVVYPDALAGGTLAGTLRKPLLLTQTDYCKPGTAAFLNQYQGAIKNIWLFGSSGAVSEKGLKSIDDVMMR
jgi:putative cell wall-binding protein